MRPAATAALSPQDRSRALSAMQDEELDLLIVGGGVVGAGAAVDAVTRGLSVGILEARDWASGTSSRSSKLIHGGLRYLEMLDFRLVREALKERGLLLQRLAPHLVRPVPFVYLLTHHVWERLYVAAGLTLYDALAAVSSTASGVPRTPPGSGPTRPSRWSANAGSSGSGPARASTWWCRATGSSPRVA